MADSIGTSILIQFWIRRDLRYIFPDSEILRRLQEEQKESRSPLWKIRMQIDNSGL